MWCGVDCQVVTKGDGILLRVGALCWRGVVRRGIALGCACDAVVRGVLDRGGRLNRGYHFC